MRGFEGLTSGLNAPMRQDSSRALPCWFALAVLALLEAATPLLNVVVFPLFDDVFTHARNISVLAVAVTLMLTSLVATFRPRLLAVRQVSRAVPVCLIAGSCLLLPALSFHLPALLVASSVMLAIGRGMVTVAVGVALARLERGSITLCVTGAFAAAYAVVAISWNLPVAVGLGLFFLGPLVAYLLIWPYARDTLFAAERDEAPADVSVTQPSTLLAFSNRLFVSVFVFKVAFGYALRFDVGDLTPWLDWLVALVAIVAVLVRVILGRGYSPTSAVEAFGPSKADACADAGTHENGDVRANAKAAAGAIGSGAWGTLAWDVFVNVTVLAVTAGLLCSMLPLRGAAAVSTSLLTAGSTLFELVSWTALVVIAARNERGAVASFAWGMGVSSLGSVVGASFGAWAGESLGVNHVVVVTAAAMLVFGLMFYVLFCLRGFSFDATIKGVVPAVDVAEPATETPSVQPDELEARCLAIAQEHGLTPREREIFLMLARGRNREYIESQLTISRNTVKAHVRHIYTKLDVHSHQELLDLVDR